MQGSLWRPRRGDALRCRQSRLKARWTNRGALLIIAAQCPSVMPVDKTAIQRQIDATDGQIDQPVYELYELTDDEIKIVEEAT